MAGDTVDTYFCITDAKADEKLPSRVLATIGAGNRTTQCASLDLTDPAKINWHMEWQGSQCPTTNGPLTYTGWAFGDKPKYCTRSEVTIPVAMRGTADMGPAGYSDAFLSVDDHSFSLVNEGALITGWCLGKSTKKADGIVELQFCNNPAGSAFCPGGAGGIAPADTGGGGGELAAAAVAAGQRRRMQYAGFMSPGRGCVWVQARSPTVFSLKVGGLLMNGTALCPTNMSGALTLPFNLTASN